MLLNPQSGIEDDAPLKEIERERERLSSRNPEEILTGSWNSKNVNCLIISYLNSKQWL